MKIRLFGGIASGKSTLAKYLGKKLKIPVFCTDDFVYTKNWGEKREEKERAKLIKNKLKKSWIVEGVHFANWVEHTYKNAEIIIIIEKPKFLLAKRIVKRTLTEEKTNNENRLFSMVKLLLIMLRDTKKEIKEYYLIAEKFNKKIIIVKKEDNGLILKKIKKLVN